MKYIQEKLSSFSMGMSMEMSEIEVFTNMEGAVSGEDLRQATIH